MRKTFTATRVMFTRLLAVMAVVCLSASSARAVDWGVMELNTDYTITGFQPYSGSFTAPETGTLKILNVSGSERVTVIYADADHNEAIDGEFSGFTASPLYDAYSVTKDKTYYLYSDFAWGDGVIRLEMDNSAAGLELSKVSPEQGSALGITGGYPYVDVYFTDKVGGITSCSLSCSGTVIKLAATPVNNVLSIGIEAAINQLYAAGVKGGADITISIDGLKNSGDVLYNGDGKLTLQFKLANEPVQLVSSKVPDLFKSYWAPGDPDAVCTFTFSGDLSTTMPADRVSLSFGSPEAEGQEYYAENVAFSVNGPVLTVDLAGVRRTPADMVSSGTNYNNIILGLHNIISADGQAVYSGGQGSSGSFFYDWAGKYLVYDKGVVIAEFDPANGTSLANATEISVWIQGVKTIKFDGFTLSCDDNGSVIRELVPMSAVTVADEGNDAKTYTFAIPAAIKGKKGVTVSLTNVLGLDGYDHSNDVSASYDTFVITGCDPANGSVLETLASGTKLTVTTNYAELYPELYIVYEIEDLNPDDPMEAIIKSESWLTRQDDGSYAAEVYGNYKLMKNHKYAVRFTAWTSEMDKNYQNDPLGTAEIYWYGATAPFQYSELSLVSISPDPESVRLTPEDNKFVVSFDGSVNIDPKHAFVLTGMGTSQAFESVEPINGSHESEGIVYNDQWQLTLDAAFLESWDASLQISIQAYDENGLIVRGNEGTEENTFFLFTYGMASEYREASLSPAAGSEVTSLKRFTVSYADGIAESYNGGKAYLMDLANRTTFDLTVSMGEGDLTSGNTEMYLDLEEEITAAGRYLLHIDEGFFNLGSEFTTWKSAGIDAEYYIESASIGGDDDTRIVTPDPDGEKLTELSRISIIYSDYSSAGLGGGKATLAIGNAAAVNLPDAEFGVEWNEVVQPLGDTYTANGTYVISFPEGYFLLGDTGDVQSKAFVLTYTIGTAGITDIVADAEGMYNIYNLNGVRVLTTDNGADIARLAPGIYIINGKKVYKN